MSISLTQRSQLIPLECLEFKTFDSCEPNRDTLFQITWRRIIGLSAESAYTMNRFVLGLDVGTSGTRAVIMGDAGEIVTSATVEHAPFASPKIGWAEQDPEDWWRAAGIAIGKALAEAQLKPEQISCVGFSGQMHGAVMLDASDHVVRPALIWCDVRSQEQCYDLTDRIGTHRLIQLTCNAALPNFTLTKFLWVRENEPANWNRVRAVMLPKDYVRFRLTGVKATDVADASGTLLLDVARRQWSN